MTNQPLYNQDDEYLVKQSLMGDKLAFKVIIKNTEALVAQIIFKMVRNSADRKDLVQDVYLKAFKSLSGFKFKSKLSTWIGQIAYNTCLHYIQKKELVLLEKFESDDDLIQELTSKLSYLPDSSVINDTEDLLQAKELLSVLQDAVEKLSPLYKTLITLYHTEELTYAEISQITSLPEGTIKSYLFRARKILKDYLSLTYKRDDL